MIDSMGLLAVRWHNHFVVPKLDDHLIVRADGDDTVIGKADADLNSEEDEAQIMSLRPSVLEQLQRHNIWRHLHHGLFRNEHVLFINHYYADAVYAPLYYGYGEPGSFADRRERARVWDKELLSLAPDTVLVLVSANADCVAMRMEKHPRHRNILKEKDIQFVLNRFQEEYEASLIERKFMLDTTGALVTDTLQEFVDEIGEHLIAGDRSTMSAKQNYAHRADSEGLKLTSRIAL